LPSKLIRTAVPRLLETDLAQPAEAFFRDRFGEQWDFAIEIELRKAGPDMVAGRHSAAFADRVAAGPAPATAERTLRLLERLLDGATDEELHAWAPWW
jgi:hypothetical protein